MRGEPIPLRLRILCLLHYREVLREAAKRPVTGGGSTEDVHQGRQPMALRPLEYADALVQLGQVVAGTGWIKPCDCQRSRIEGRSSSRDRLRWKGPHSKTSRGSSRLIGERSGSATATYNLSPPWSRRRIRTPDRGALWPRRAIPTDRHRGGGQGPRACQGRRRAEWAQ